MSIEVEIILVVERERECGVVVFINVTSLVPKILILYFQKANPGFSSELLQ